MEAFSGLRTPAFVLDESEIRATVEGLCYSARPVFTGDRFAVNHYLGGGRYMWIDRKGVDLRADTLLSTLRSVGDAGFSMRSFFVDEIERDLQRARNLDFDGGDNTASKVLGRLEYHLTMACFRYVVGMRFGFVNPSVVLNKVDTIDGNGKTRATRYKTLFAIDIEHPGRDYADSVLNGMAGGVSAMLAGLAPRDTMYAALQRRLVTATGKERVAVLCNMERCRWRLKEPVNKSGRRVVVNIPAFHLYAHGGDSLLDMRVGCGARKTKTPLLVSCVERMDVNPVWNIPMSITRDDIAPRATDTSYFSRNRYYVVERSSGERVDQAEVTEEMLLSGDYRVVQEGGEGNSLGRIIFRFANDFSVFLHDTSSKGVFGRSVRSVSHGCVRVQKPFELAEFLLDGADDWTLDKLRISMGLEPKTRRGKSFVAENEDGEMRLVRSLRVEPCVPIYLLYYTIYPDETGKLRTYPDIYGYDDVIYGSIKLLVE